MTCNITKEDKLYEFGRESASIALHRIIRDGKRNDGTGSLDLIPCDAIGEIMHRKEPLKENHFIALEYLVEYAKYAQQKGVADYLLGAARRYMSNYTNEKV